MKLEFVKSVMMDIIRLKKISPNGASHAQSVMKVSIRSFYDPIAQNIKTFIHKQVLFHSL